MYIKYNTCIRITLSYATCVSTIWPELVSVESTTQRVEKLGQKGSLLSSWHLIIIKYSGASVRNYDELNS